MNRVFIATTVAVLFASTTAFAGANSRFQHCYKIKDTQEKAAYMLDTVPNDFRFPDVDGCQIKIPAKTICVDSYDIGLTPTPPGVPGGYSGQKYLCYKAKCPAPEAPITVGVGDALGVREVTASKSSQICIPIIQDTCVEADDCRARQHVTTAVCLTNGFCDADVCAAGYVDCNSYFPDGCETSINDDSYNCGACGNYCDYPYSYGNCASGTCNLDYCYADYADCDLTLGTGCEAYLPSDPNNCGACGNVCSIPNAAAACTSNTCVIGSCDAGYGDCNIDNSDGCETYVSGSDAANCGGCGVVCSGSCTAGICTP